MDVAITGSHGLIGRALAESLQRDGHRVVPIGHDKLDARLLAGADAVVHLAGEPVAGGPWTAARKARIHDSRADGTAQLAGLLAKLDDRPRVLVSGSAIGYYGDRGDDDLVESSAAGHDFLAGVCQAWEAATAAAATAGIRVATIRTGVVLTGDGGMLAKVLPPARLGLGGPAGRGDQWLSWITLADEVAAIRFLVDHDISGPVNLTAPAPVTNRDFNRTLGRVLHRPARLRIPRLVTHLPLGVGPLVRSLLFSSAKVHPQVLSDAGFRFSQTELEPALRSLLSR